MDFAAATHCFSVLLFDVPHLAPAIQAVEDGCCRESCDQEQQ
jgi:hypothetical protein